MAMPDPQKPGEAAVLAGRCGARRRGPGGGGPVAGWWRGGTGGGVPEAVARVARAGVVRRCGTGAAVKAARRSTRGGAREAHSGGGSILSLTITIRPTTSRGQSCRISTFASTNQQILRRWRKERRFTIFNTNDLLGGLERIGREQNEFYILGYVPGDTPEGSCHTLKVKLNRGGLNVRARSDIATRDPQTCSKASPWKNSSNRTPWFSARLDSWRIAGALFLHCA